MVKIELTIDEIDYDALIENYLPQITEKLRESGNPLASMLSGGSASSMVKGFFQRLPDSRKDAMAAELINNNAQSLKLQLENYARSQGISGKAVELRASVK